MSGGMTARREDPRARPAPGAPAEVGQRNGIMLVLCSALCFASLGVLAQVAHRAGVSVATLVSTRFLLAAIVFWIMVKVMRRPLPDRRDALLAVALGVAYSAHTTLLFVSLTETKAAIVDLLFFTYPALVAMGAFGLRRERWCGRRAAAVAATLVGTAMVLGGSVVGVNAGGAGLALAAALVYAGYILAASSLLPRIDALVFVALLTSGAATAATAGGLVLGQLQSSFSTRDILLLAAIALVSTVLGISSFVAGVARLGPSRASIVSGIQPALTAVLAFLAFRDRLGVLQLVGGALVLGTIVVLESASLRVRPKPASSPTAATPSADVARPIVVRLNEPADRRALARLARLDAKQLPPEPLLIAEVDGEILAATPLQGIAQPLSDPCTRATHHLIELLELRAAQLRQPNHRHTLKPITGTATA